MVCEEQEGQSGESIEGVVRSRRAKVARELKEWLVRSRRARVVRELKEW